MDASRKTIKIMFGLMKNNDTPTTAISYNNVHICNNFVISTFELR